MPRRTQAESEATARRVLATATALFASEGYAAVGLERIAEQADVTRGAIYHHYASKLELFGAALAQVQADVGQQVEAAALAAGNGWPGLEAGCRAFLAAAVDESRRRILLLDGPAVLGWQTWRDLDAANAGASLQAGLQDLADADQLNHGIDPTAAAALLSGAMNEAALWIAASADRPQTSAAAWRTLQRLLTALAAK